MDLDGGVLSLGLPHAPLDYPGDRSRCDAVVVAVAVVVALAAASTDD